MTEKKMYYGIGPVPKGKIRAPPEHCVRMNQIRYYGIKAIDKTLLQESRQLAPNLLKEQFKLKEIENRARVLLNDYKTIKLILEKDNIPPSKLSKLEKKMENLLNKRDILIKKFRNQKKIVDSIEKEKKRAIKKSDDDTSSDSSDESNKSSSDDFIEEETKSDDKFHKQNQQTVSDDKMYCGIGPVPRGMVRATPEYCLQTNQIRYYGIKAIDKDLLKNFKEGTSDLLKEQLKMKRIEESAKILIKDIKETQIILDQQDEDSSMYQDAIEKMNELQTKKKSIIKKIKLQKKKIEKMEKADKKKNIK